MANGVSKYPSFHTDFKNVNLISVKNAPKKVLAQTLFFGKKKRRVGTFYELKSPKCKQPLNIS
jgi:hypothetical protein